MRGHIFMKQSAAKTLGVAALGAAFAATGAGAATAAPALPRNTGGVHNPSAFRCLRRAVRRVYGHSTAHIPV
ncbi:hypothetical protein ACWGAD_14020, partial [Streptomyces sp. NPDC055058]